MIRVLPVSERAIRVVRSALLDISTQNGYNFDWPGGVVRGYYDPEVRWRFSMIFGPAREIAEYAEGVTNVRHEELGCRIAFVFESRFEDESQDLDLTYNLAVADLQAALPSGPNRYLVDPTYPGYPQCRKIVQLRHGTKIPHYNPKMQPISSGEFHIFIRYHYIKDNPFRWDKDDKEVKEEFADV